MKTSAGFVLMASGKLPQIVVNKQTKEGPFLTFLVDVGEKKLFCLEPRNFPSHSVSELKRRKHMRLRDDLLELFRNCALIRSFLKRYLDYYKKHGKQAPKETESVWISNLNSLEIKTNNKFAAVGQ